MRDNGPPQSPVDGICSACTSTGIASTTVGWRCTTGSKSDTKSAAYIGVASFFECRQVGVNTAATEADWHPYESAATVDSAVCCH